MRVIIHDDAAAAAVVDRKKQPVWLPQAVDRDYGNAADYLGLIMPDKQVQAAVSALRDAPLVQKRANDILRAAAHEPLPKDDPGVDEQRKNIKDEKPLAPVMLIQGGASTGWALIVADGWHRVNACVFIDPDIEIPCKLATGIFQ